MAVPTDDPTDLFDGPFTLAALDRCEADVAGVERALADLDGGSFGRCDSCGAPIDADSLGVDPFERRCRQHRETGASPAA